LGNGADHYRRCSLQLFDALHAIVIGTVNYFRIAGRRKFGFGHAGSHRGSPSTTAAAAVPASAAIAIPVVPGRPILARSLRPFLSGCDDASDGGRCDSGLDFDRRRCRSFYRKHRGAGRAISPIPISTTITAVAAITASTAATTGLVLGNIFTGGDTLVVFAGLLQEIRNVKESVALESKLDERGLHSRQNAGDASFVNATYQRVFIGPLEKNLD